MLLAPKLEPGDVVRSISSTADENELNNAFRDPAVRAIVISASGNGAHQIAHRLDFEAVRRDPKLVIGRAQATYLHLALWRECGLAGLHGSPGQQALMTTEPIALHSNQDDLSAQAVVHGRATGSLIGGTLSALTRSIGAGLPSLDGAILLIEDIRTVGLGVVDRSLTHLLRSGVLRGLRGVALGQFTGFDDYTDRGWTVVDVLKDRLGKFDVPVLGGLPIGHGPEALAVPVGPEAVLDTQAGTLIVQPAVT